MLSEKTICEKMIEGQLRSDGVIDPKIVDAFLSVNREIFAPAKYKDISYMDGIIPISEGQEMMSPKTVGKILQALDIKKDECVLQIGSGTGYVSALLAKLAKKVDIIELSSSLIKETEKNLDKAKVNNFKITQGDAVFGWKSSSKHDVIIITASMPEMIENLLDNLTIEGRIIVILGNPPAMQVTLIQKIAQKKYHRSILFETVVPRLIGVATPEKFEF
jgi:protein-L-isoaspartate(D-aspartate) O-methyltransferase